MHSKMRESCASVRPQRGYSLLEMLVVVVLIALLSVIAFGIFVDTRSTVDSTRALTEINTIIGSAQRYRTTFAQGGLYTGISIAALTARNYPVGGIDTRGNRNVYEVVVGLAPTTAAAEDATLLYTTESAAACTGLRDIFASGTGGTDAVPGIVSATCATATLNIVID